MSNITHIDGDKLDDAIGVGKGLVLIDYWAPWCGPCRALAPILEDLASDFASEVSVGKVDVEAFPDVRTKMNIQGIPVLGLYRDGAEVARQIGIKSRSELTQWIESHL